MFHLYQWCQSKILIKIIIIYVKNLLQFSLQVGTFINYSNTSLWQAPPFVMLKKDASPEVAERYEGFSVDLCREVAALLGFNFSLTVVEDDRRGEFSVKQQRWTGMVGELLDRVKTGHKVENG